MAGIKKTTAPLSTSSNGDDPNAGLEWARCRSLGHEWAHSSKTVGSASTGGIGFPSRCKFCGTTRTKWITRSGTLGAMTYEHPKDYSRHGDNKLSTVQWRRTFVTTLFGDEG